MTGLTYAGVGVNYEELDPFKRAAQRLAAETAINLTPHGLSEVTGTRGESAYLIELPDRYLAHVEEGLGTKNLDAQAWYELTGDASGFACVAQDTVAMIVNDMITLGAFPLSIAMHLAVGDSAWFNDDVRAQALLKGWQAACDLSVASWGGGETPALRGVVESGTFVFSGSAMGQVCPKEALITDRIEDGDAIVFIGGSGIHANGLTMARRIITSQPEGYHALLSDGTSVGKALLTPTPIYVKFLAHCLSLGIDIRYAVNVTGHGWRKLMRSPKSFDYVINKLPFRQPLFDYLLEHGPVEEREAYGTFNMGAGFALIVPRSDLRRFALLLDLGHTIDVVGYVRKSDSRRVIIEPKGITFEGSELNLR